jgi:Iron-containing redox enzyme
VLRLPTPRGETSEALLSALRRAPGEGRLPGPAADDPLAGDDQHLALYLLYELTYRGLPGVDDRWEWDPGLVALRSALEDRFENALFGEVGPPSDGVEPEETDLALRAIADADPAPSLSTFVERSATLKQVLEFLVHRSAYQLKEADPHSWALPRLWGPPKAAMVAIQADEYGGGHVDRIHAELFARAMRAVGLDARYGAYLDVIPGVTLATVNLMSMLGLHRRRRGAVVGHLALFEMTSSLPNARYARGLRRLGFEGDATAFFDEHVEADAVHENLAAVDLAGGLARQQPELARDILWGARALVDVEARWASHVVAAWEAGESSLRVPLAASTLLTGARA